MPSRQFVSVLVLLLLPFSIQLASAAEKMNLLVIETDEHHFSTLGCYGGKIVGTPNIDWLAKNGALLSLIHI